MTKRILTAALFGLLLAAPVATYATEVEISETEMLYQDVRVAVEGRTLQIEGAEGKTLVVYDVAGNAVLTMAVESDSQRVTLNVPRGLYIVRVGNVARKIQLR